MTNARIRYYLTIANEIAPSSRNPYDLCKELEVEVINNRELHKDAYFICQEGLKLIFVNSCIKNRHRRKFVTAHEIGHYFLHQDELYCCNNISEINLSSSIKVNSSSQEYEANTFASEYVLPTSLLQEKLPNREIHFSDIFTIANEFDVSVTLTAMKSIQCSKTESESLLCYENNRLKWFAFSNNNDMDKSAIPSRCPFDSLLCSQTADITGYWDDLYRGSVHQEVFSPYGKQRLILLSGQRNID